MPRACLEFPSGTGMNNWRCIGLMQRCSSLFCFPPQIPCDHIMKTLSVLLPKVLIAKLKLSRVDASYRNLRSCGSG